MGFFGSFFGSDQRKDLKRGYADQQASLNSGLSQLTRNYNTANTNAQSHLEPFAQSGEDALSLYNDYLGVNGADARATFFSDFAQMPGEFQAAQDYGIRGLDRSASARGMNISGGQLEALQDFGMKNYADFLNPYVDRLAGASQQGANIAGQQAGYDYQTGTGIGDAAFGKAQLDANNAAGYANQMAASRSIPINNLLGLLNVGARAYGAKA